MKIEHKSFKAEFKAGTYFIGDPCYVLRDDLYDKWGTDNNYSDGNYGYFAVGSTAYGDGIYEDIASGKNYFVDAGILGIVNMDYSKQEFPYVYSLNELGSIITVKESLLFEYNHETHTFKYEYDDDNIIFIETGFEEDDNEEY